MATAPCEALTTVIQATKPIVKMAIAQQSMASKVTIETKTDKAP